MYTHCTHGSVKKKIIEQFTKQSSLRVVIATIAFRMGIDCPDVRHIIHWSVPSDAEMHVQESGRAGRDGELSCATISPDSIHILNPHDHHCHHYLLHHHHQHQYSLRYHWCPVR